LPDRHDALEALAFFEHRLVQARWSLTARRPVSADQFRVDFSRMLVTVTGFARTPLPSPPQVDIGGRAGRIDTLHALQALDRAVFQTRCAVHRRDPAPAIPALCCAYEEVAALLPTILIPNRTTCQEDTSCPPAHPPADAPASRFGAPPARP
jgi:hypothetical protein